MMPRKISEILKDMVTAPDGVTMLPSLLPKIVGESMYVMDPVFPQPEKWGPAKYFHRKSHLPQWIRALPRKGWPK